MIGPAQDAGGRDLAGYYGPQHTCYYPKYPGVADALSSGGKVKIGINPIVTLRKQLLKC